MSEWLCVCTSYSIKWHTLRGKMLFFYIFKIKYREMSSKKIERTHGRCSKVIYFCKRIHHRYITLSFKGKFRWVKNSLSEQILFIFIARFCLLAYTFTAFVETIRHTQSPMHMYVCVLQWNSNLWIYGFHNFSMWNDSFSV